MTRAIVLLSGGIDSAVALYWAASRGWDLHALEFEYYLRPESERRACTALRARAGVENSIVTPLDFIREVGDLPDGDLVNTSLKLAPEGYIPGRNLIFYSLAAYHAEILKVRYVIGGHNRTDAESFPDASAGYFECLNQLFKLGMWSHNRTRTEVLLPLVGLDKIGVLKLGARMSVPFEATWSCYHNGVVPCARCDSCKERAEAFVAVGWSDPLVTNQPSR